MTEELKQEIQVYKNLIKKRLDKEAECQMDRVIETIREEIIEKVENYDLSLIGDRVKKLIINLIKDE